MIHRHPFPIPLLYTSHVAEYFGNFANPPFFFFNPFTLPILPVIVNLHSPILLYNSKLSQSFSLTTLLSDDGGGSNLACSIWDLADHGVTGFGFNLCFPLSRLHLTQTEPEKIKSHCPSQIDRRGGVGGWRGVWWVWGDVEIWDEVGVRRWWIWDLKESKRSGPTAAARRAFGWDRSSTMVGGDL